MDVISIIQALTALGSVLAAVLAWAAKLQWSKEFKEAKEAQIRALKGQIDALQAAQEERLKAKDEQILTLNEKLKSLQDMTSEKTKEFFEFTKSQLESYNEKLGLRVQELEESIRDKEDLIKSFSTNQAQHSQKVEELENQKRTVESKLIEIETEKRKLEKALESTRDISPKDLDVRREMIELSSTPKISSPDTSRIPTALGVVAALGPLVLTDPSLALASFTLLKTIFEKRNRDNQ